METVNGATPNGSSLKAFGEEEVHRLWEAIQHDSQLMDTAHDS